MKSYAHQDRIVGEAIPNLIRHGGHAIFAEIGTGKSRMILEITARLAGVHLGGLIIVAPKSLSGSWREQVETHCSIGGYSFSTFDAGQAKTVKWQTAYRQALSHSFPILFVNVEAFQTMPRVLQDALADFHARAPDFLLAIDESSAIKGPKANRTLNLQKFGRKAWGRLISTGTEITNSVLDLYSQFEFLKEGFWGFKSFFFFKNYFAVLEERYLSGGRTFKKIVGFRKLNELQAQIAPFTSRALKKDCLDLPDKVYARLPVHLSGECERVYRELKRSLVTMLDSGEILTVANKMVLFGKFRQIVGGTLAGVGVIDKMPAKLAALMDELEDHNEQAIIWSSFTEEIDLIMSHLGDKAVRFDGRVGTDERNSGIELFRSGTRRLFVANPAAASQGLNLQNCHLEYWYSLPTSAQQYEQAEGRIHRSGQTEKCVYKQILAENTVDYRLAEILAEKTDIMAAFRDGNVRDILDVI